MHTVVFTQYQGLTVLPTSSCDSESRRDVQCSIDGHGLNGPHQSCLHQANVSCLSSGIRLHLFLFTSYTRRPFPVSNSSAALQEPPLHAPSAVKPLREQSAQHLCHNTPHKSVETPPLSGKNDKISCKIRSDDSLLLRGTNVLCM